MAIALEGRTVFEPTPVKPLRNPFTNAKTEPVAGAAANPGETGYQVLVDVVGVNVGYKITGFGKSAVIITLQSGS